jgi:hypothetical protein
MEGDIMRKYVIGGLILLVMVIVLLALDIFYFDYLEIPDRIIDYRTERFFLRMYGIRDGDLIDLQLYERYDVDTSGLRNDLRIVEGTPFTYFLQMRRIDHWKRDERFGEANFYFPGFDYEANYFQGNYLVISFGREIVEIRRTGLIHYGEFPVTVTFAEEYQGDVMFLYLMDEVPFRLGTAHQFYIMDGAERVFLEMGMHSLNEWRMD